MPGNAAFINTKEHMFNPAVIKPCNYKIPSSAKL